MLYAVLPIKQLSLAKQRLSGVLTDSERQALFQAMLEDVLSLLQSYSEIAQVLIVSRDPLVKLLADKYRCVYIEETGKGLNQAVQQGLAALPVEAQRALVLHGDLPLLNQSGLAQLLATPVAVAIATDQQQQGTNLMCLDLRARPELDFASQFGFAYGVASCQAHQAQAELLGLSCRVLVQAELALDIDQASDLLDLIAILDAQQSQSFSANYLRASSIVSRLENMGLAQVNTSARPDQIEAH